MKTRKYKVVTFLFLLTLITNISAGQGDEGFVSLFNGTDFTGWLHNEERSNYVIEDGVIRLRKEKGKSGHLSTEKEYANFIFRFEFKLTPNANNGIGIRTPGKGNAAYEGMELQILDNTGPRWQKLEPYQYHGSVYGCFAAKRGALKPTGEWNSQEIIVDGSQLKVTLNGTVITECDLGALTPLDGKEHPGLKNKSGFIKLLGHGSEVYFRNFMVKELP